MWFDLGVTCYYRKEIRREIQQQHATTRAPAASQAQRGRDCVMLQLINTVTVVTAIILWQCRYTWWHHVIERTCTSTLVQLHYSSFIKQWITLPRESPLYALFIWWIDLRRTRCRRIVRLVVRSIRCVHSNVTYVMGKHVASGLVRHDNCISMARQAMIRYWGLWEDSLFNAHASDILQNWPSSLCLRHTL